jgi:hypothetical protein
VRRGLGNEDKKIYIEQKGKDDMGERSEIALLRTTAPDASTHIAILEGSRHPFTFITAMESPHADAPTLAS